MKKNTIISTLQIICIIVLMVSLIKIVSYYVESYQEKQKASNIASMVDSSEKETVKESESQKEMEYEDKKPVIAKLDARMVWLQYIISQIPKTIPKYEKLYQSNNDFIGWICIEGTRVNYPVLQTDNNEFYLDHDFYKDKSRYGSLFVDYRVSPYESMQNIIIYGHNMKDGAMFHEIMNYAKESYYQKHKVIQFDTKYKEANYEVVSAFYTTVKTVNSDEFKYYQYISLSKEEEFLEFVSNIKQMSQYDTQVEPVYGDTFITLSTCSHHVENGRFVVVARKID